MNEHQPIEEPAGHAVASRLRRLRALPVDTSRLDRRLRAEIRPELPVVLRLMRPLSAVAASAAVLLLVIGLLLTGSSGQVLASPAQMAQFHRDIIENRAVVTKVDSIDEASRVLAAQWPQTPDLPEAPQAHVMACCMKSIHDKRVACVLLKSEATPITMSVANASDMRLPKSPAVARNGVKYYLESFGNLNMVSAERNGRWICLIGETPQDRLVELAEQLQF
jgi:hypothetical protein